MTVTAACISAAIERLAPLTLKADWDNPGWQVLPFAADTPVAGVMACVDVTPDVIARAAASGCNVVVSHHPTLFRGLKRIAGATLPEQTVIDAIRAGVGVYASHTPLDRAPRGINTWLAEGLGLKDVEPLPDFGVVGNLSCPLAPDALILRAKELCGAAIARCSRAIPEQVSRVALCSGAGGECIPDAIAAGAQAFLSADIRHHDFVDYGRQILLIDLTHFQTEQCAARIMADELAAAFPGLKVVTADEPDPIVFI